MEWNQKKRRPNRIEELIEKSLDIQKSVREVDTDRISRRKRIEKSLLLSDDKECHSIFGRIENCKKFQKKRRKGDRFYEGHSNVNGEPLNPFTDVPKYVGGYINNKDVCQSLWCPNCRKFLSKMYENKIRQRLTERLLPSEYTNDDFHHISGVLGVCEVDEKEVLKLISDDTNRWRRIRYRVNTLIKPKDCPFIESVYEFELVNWTFLRSSSLSDFKKKQIQQLIEHQRFRGSVFLFVHFHSITNLSKEQITEVFRDEYFVGDKPLIKTNKENGLFVQKFHSKQTLEKNIEKLCSYPFKDPHRFKHSFRGSDYLNGEYFEYEELSQLIKVYQKVQKRSWRGLFRTVEHPLSVEYLKYKKWFPSDHRMWGQYVKFDGGEVIPKTNRIQLDPVWIVDEDGDVYTEGWDPNKYFRFGLTYNLIQPHRTKIGYKKITTDYEEFVVPNYREDKPPSIVPIPIRLEQFYYPNEFNLLKKEQFFQSGRWEGYYSRKDPPSLQLIRINWSDRLPMKVEFGIDDRLSEQRFETVKRLMETERVMYLNHQIKKDRDRRKSESQKEEDSDVIKEDFDRLIDRIKSESLIDPNFDFDILN